MTGALFTMASKGCRLWVCLGSRLRRPVVSRLRGQAQERPREQQPREQRAPPAAPSALPRHRLALPVPRVSLIPLLLSDLPALLPSALAPLLLRSALPAPRLPPLALPVPRLHLLALRDLPRTGAVVQDSGPAVP